jgi:hypothetical protein
MLFPPERIIPVILFLDSKITSDKIYYVNFRTMGLSGRSEPKHGVVHHAEFMRTIMNYEDLPIGIEYAFSLLWPEIESLPILPETFGFNKT